MNNIDLPAKAWEMKEGKIIKVNIEGQIYSLVRETHPELLQQPKITTQQKDIIPIYAPAFQEVKKALSNDKDADIIPVLKHFYSHVNDATLKRYSHVYKRALQDAYPRKFSGLVNKRRSYIRRKKYTKRPAPADSVGFCRTYNRHVKKEEMHKVLQTIGIVELNYRPTSKEIEKRTGLKKTTLSSILRFLLDNDTIGYRSEGKQKVYFKKHQIQPSPSYNVLEELKHGPFTVVELAKRLECGKPEIREELQRLINTDKVEKTSTDSGIIVYKRK